MDLSQGHGEGQAKKIHQAEKQIFILLLLVTFAFLVLYTPVNVMIFYVNYIKGNSADYLAGLHLFYHVAEKAYFTNHGINFFLYVLSGQKFRTDLVSLFWRSKQHGSGSLSNSKLSMNTAMENL